MWIYQSNEYEHISLHDNEINEIYIENNDIILTFNDGFDVVKTHPLNDTSKSKHTTKSQIILQNSKFTYATLCLGTNKMTGTDEYERLTYSPFVDAFDCYEVLAFSYEKGILNLLGNLTGGEYKNDVFELNFLISDLIFCWNDYSQDSWFEGWPKRTV